ncbi:hypothetical protein BDZ94DRAFT_1267516 [Collybia nuda]|uniref:Uncharacterized protein n=1 Tax=Collybia nuda TaxID=64659 RepID=A0A9P5XZR4_9AGAR|nr:hypothetical protein BDZ94DRAFT_1267516 [Collybia nuda]
MHRREEALRQAASGIGALSAAAIKQEEEAFQQTKERIRQVLLAAFASAAQQGVHFTPYEPEPVNAIALYELKWEELKVNKAQLQPQQLTLTQLPWPVFEFVTDPDIITYGAVHAFVFNEMRPGAKNKTKRDRLRPEILRYHPDKFNSNILPLVHPDHVEGVMIAADRVVKLLNHLMELPM